MSTPTVGSAAPPFSLETDEERTLSLEELKGRKVVLFFYPKDDTSGCTIEVCEFRDALPRFSSSDAVILGISPDDAKSHRQFKEKFALPYTLLVDEGHAIAEQYGVWKEKSMYGRPYMGVERTTFLIDRDGRIARVFEKVNPEGHAEEVREAVEALG